jgi:hypothetical protein
MAAQPFADRSENLVVLHERNIKALFPAVRTKTRGCLKARALVAPTNQKQTKSSGRTNLRCQFQKIGAKHFMKIGFICPQAPGHLNAFTALARHTQERSHEVVLLFSSGSGGLPFIPGEEQERIVTESRAEISKRQGEDALKFSMGLLMDMSESMIKALPGIVKSNQIDALVIDDISFYVQLAALELGIPYIHASAAMHFDYSGHTPLMMYPWPHETTPPPGLETEMGQRNLSRC